MSAMTGSMLEYFWTEKGDIERYASYSEAECANRFPHVLMAWKNYLAAKKLMDAAVESVRHEGDEL